MHNTIVQYYDGRSDIFDPHSTKYTVQSTRYTINSAQYYSTVLWWKIGRLRSALSLTREHVSRIMFIRKQVRAWVKVMWLTFRRVPYFFYCVFHISCLNGLVSTVKLTEISFHLSDNEPKPNNNETTTSNNYSVQPYQPTTIPPYNLPTNLPTYQPTVKWIAWLQ